MAIMKKLFAPLVMMAGFGLATAGTACADDQGFIDAIDNVGHYSTVYPDETIEIGQQVCTIFDNGGDGQAAVDWVLKRYQGPGNGPNEEYYATLFAQSAAFELCTEHNREIGPI
jgi:hypothetical protein